MSIYGMFKGVLLKEGFALQDQWKARVKSFPKTKGARLRVLYAPITQGDAADLCAKTGQTVVFERKERGRAGARDQYWQRCAKNGGVVCLEAILASNDDVSVLKDAGFPLSGSSKDKFDEGYSFRAGETVGVAVSFPTQGAGK